MAWKIGGSLGKFWEKNKGTIAKVGGGALGMALGGPAGAALGAGLGSTVQNRQAAPATSGEMADLAKRRTTALNDLETDSRNPYQAQLINDPVAGVSYDAPKAGPRNTTLFDKATAMQRPGGAIANDAMDELRGLGEFSYKDRPPEQMFNDNLEEIKGYRGRAGDIAEEFARGGIPGGDSQGSRVGAQSVSNMDERADVSELMSFDPSAAFEKYMQGASGKMGETLNTANERLTNTAAGGNRLNTGFFDLDRGELGRQISADTRNDVMSKALDTNQQKLSAITSGSTLRAGDLNNLRQQYLDAQTGNADRALRADTVNAGSADEAAQRNADFRLKSLGYLGDSDQLRLDAMTTGRDYMVGDQKRRDDLFSEDRDFARGTRGDWADTLGKISTVQRDDRARGDDLFSEDRDFLMGADKQRQGDYESDRDYDLDAWGLGNETRFKGGAVARDDRDFTQRTRDESRNRYLDFLSGTSDRAQGAANAAATTAANRANSRNDMWGQIAGVGGGLLSDYMAGGGKMPSFGWGGRSSGSGSAGIIDPAEIDAYEDQYSPDAIENWRRPR